ncbi:hypothetical protein X777_12051 [Ooceraea biroi]|uniref:Uncharacterized protein n=1 Tax=Ooceraea biroi TaxID=2015173 RepID=A0A026X1S5_OOCBI|nr:hypothetical protein X777_12051 [Ooceraea biroi]
MVPHHLFHLPCSLRRRPFRQNIGQQHNRPPRTVDRNSYSPQPHRTTCTKIVV